MEIFRRRERDPKRTDETPGAMRPPGDTPAIRLPGDTPALGEPAPEANVQVISGACLQMLPLVGLQITEARQLAESILGIDSRAIVLVNGEPVRGNYRLSSQDTLEFVHHAGEKGGLP
jgi:hypothetical protein